MTKILTKIEQYLLYIVVAIYPVLVVLSISSPVTVPKSILLVFSLSILLILWVIRAVINGSITFHSGRFDLGVALIAIVYILATIFASPNKMEALLIPGTTTFVVAACVLYFFINQLGDAAKKSVLISFFISGILYSVTILFVQANLFSKIPQLPLAIKDATFNPLGGALPGILYLIPVLFVGVSLIIREKDMMRKLFWGGFKRGFIASSCDINYQRSPR